MKYALASVFLLSAGLAAAQSAQPAAPPPPETGTTQTTPHSESSTLGTHKMQASVVSTDASARTITVKNLAMSGSKPSTSGTGSYGTETPVTLRVEEAAVNTLKNIKSGDNVVLTCQLSTGSTGSTGATGSTGSTGNTMADTECGKVTAISKSASR